MARTKISEFSATPANNTDIDSINIAQDCAPSGINDAIRELMSQLKDFQTGAQGDSFGGPVNGALNGTVGATTPNTGAFTTLSATGVTTVQAGTAALPAITTTGDTNTGIFFPAADTIAFSEGGVEAMRLDSSGDVNLYNAKSFKVYNPTNTRYGSFFTDGNGTNLASHNGSGEPVLLNSPTGYIALSTNGSERARIESSGNLLVGCTTTPISGTAGIFISSPATNGIISGSNTTASTLHVRYHNNNGQVGSITTSGSATTYTTSSDYRLKHDIAPMVGALAKVSALKPVTYKWNADNADGEGFIAHELQAVIPDAVVGEKDAVDANGNPQYQGIDTSFLVATLTAAIQELKAEFDAYKASHP